MSGYLTRDLQAEFMSGYLYWKPVDKVFFGNTFWPSVIITALSLLSTIFKIKLGTGNMAGRYKALANAWNEIYLLIFFIVVLRLNTNKLILKDSRKLIRIYYKTIQE